MMAHAKKRKAGKPGESRSVVLGLSAVIVAVQDGNPKVFVVRGAEHALSTGIAPAHEEGDALPFGPFDPGSHPTMELGLRAWIRDQTPLSPGYVEQLYTFGNRDRYMGQDSDAQARRVISVGYLALVHHDERAHTTDKVFWGDWYGFFPWEDWRAGRPGAVLDVIEPRLKRWIAAAPGREERDRRRMRADLCFGLSGSPWDSEKVLERYELLYEARLVHESIRDRRMKADDVPAPGKSMLYDHRRILATAMGRLRGKLKYRPVVFELLPPEFTLLQLQKTVEAIMGHKIHKQNFRRLVESTGMVEEVPGRKSSAAGGRPAALFRFRKEVVLERPAPGVKVSGALGHRRG